MWNGTDRKAFVAEGPSWAPNGALAAPGGVELATGVGVSDDLYVASGAQGGNRSYARFLTGTPYWIELVPTSLDISYGARVAVADGREILVSAPGNPGPGKVHVFTVLRELGDPCGMGAQCRTGYCDGSGACSEPPQQDGGGDAGDDAGTVGDGGATDAPPADGAADGAVGDGGGAGDGAGGDGRGHTTDFYSCDCTVGRAATPPGLVTLVLGAALGAAWRARRRGGSRR
jgi:hypothetical protein